MYKLTLYAILLSIPIVGYADDQSPQSISQPTNTGSQWKETGGQATYDGSLFVTGATTVGRFEESIAASTPVAPGTNHFRVFYSSGSKKLCGEDENSAITCFAAATTLVNLIPLNNVWTGVNTFTSTTTLTGVTDASDATAGKVGEVVRSRAGNVTASSSGQAYDVTSITLTAGDWDISCGEGFAAGSGTTNYVRGGIGTASGTSQTGMVEGDSEIDTAPPTANYDTGISVANFRTSITTSTTYYLKSVISWTGGTAPAANGRISARRIR